ncbi:type II toxin-antitoxin system VapB family antitoxin [Micromonospora sp. NPDC023888]|uniref:type II toxin-antitoxin system VapB family antitoxin n=1 Tax=Micromonospora sp. NPDC023888 TaxID=3155607 RepID=UPI003406E3E3
MKTVIDLDDELLERARRELGTKSKKDTIHAALRLVAERSERMEAIRELISISIEQDWTGLVEDDKTPRGEQDAA